MALAASRQSAGSFKSELLYQFLKKPIGGRGVRWDLFQQAATQILHRLWNAPKPEIGGTVQAEKTSVAVETLFWGCPVTYFMAKLPFHGMRQDFAAC
jgi:hypothetical protein